MKPETISVIVAALHDRIGLCEDTARVARLKLDHAVDMLGMKQSAGEKRHAEFAVSKANDELKDAIEMLRDTKAALDDVDVHYLRTR